MLGQLSFRYRVWPIRLGGSGGQGASGGFSIPTVPLRVLPGAGDGAPVPAVRCLGSSQTGFPQALWNEMGLSPSPWDKAIIIWWGFNGALWNESCVGLHGSSPCFHCVLTTGWVIECLSMCDRLHCYEVIISISVLKSPEPPSQCCVWPCRECCCLCPCLMMPASSVQ